MSKLKKWLKSAKKWVICHLKDKIFRRTFYIVCIVLYSEVWIPYLVAFIIGIHETISKWLIGFASIWVGIWASPLLPFFPVALAVTEFFYAIVFKKEKKHKDL